MLILLLGILWVKFEQPFFADTLILHNDRAAVILKDKNYWLINICKKQGKHEYPEYRSRLYGVEYVIDFIFVGFRLEIESWGHVLTTCVGLTEWLGCSPNEPLIFLLSFKIVEFIL